MFTVDEYRHELWREVTERAQDHDIYDQEAFFETACEILRDSEAIAAYHPAYTRYRMGTPQALAIDGYDQDAFEMDESIVVIACDDKFTLAENDALPTIQSNECKRYFNAMRRFVVAALNSTYQAHAEESSETFDPDRPIRERQWGQQDQFGNPHLGYPTLDGILQCGTHRTYVDSSRERTTRCQGLQGQ